MDMLSYVLEGTAKISQPPKWGIAQAWLTAGRKVRVTFQIEQEGGEDRAGLAALIYDIVLKETESFEFGHIGVSLAYLMGAILKGDKVDVYNTNRDPNFGHLYSILLTHCPEPHPVWRFINKRAEL